MAAPRWAAAALLLGCLAGEELPRGSIPLAAALGALGAALQGLPGAAIAGLGGGLAAAWSRSPAVFEGLDEERPVVLTARLSGHWSRGRFGWSAPMRAERLRQGGRAGRWRARVRVSLPVSMTEPPSGVRWRFRGFLRRSSGGANGVAAPPGVWRLRIRSSRFVSGEPGGRLDTPWRLSIAVRGVIERRLGRFRRDSPGLLMTRALVLGDPGALPVAVLRGMRRWGLSHLVAVSGLHLGILGVAGWWMGRALPGALRWLPVLAGPAVYLLLAGPRPSLLRASAMALLAVVSLVLERPPRGLHALALAAAGLAALTPETTGDLGFRLTVSATAGILLAARAFAAAWTALPGILARPLAVSVAAQLGALPWTVPAFHLAAPAAAVLNLAAVPWIAVTLACALLWALTAVISPPAAGVGLTVLDRVAAPFWMAAELPASEFLTLPWNVGFVTAAGVSAGLFWALRGPRRRSPAVIGALLLAAAAARSPVGDPPELLVLDVGQGDALLMLDRGRAALVDGGGWPDADLGGRVLLPVLAARGIRRLEAVILTHPDLDHCAGLRDIASYLPVAEVWMAPGWPAVSCASDLASSPRTRLRPVWAGETGRLGRWRIVVLHPAPGDRGRGNDGSLVLRVAVRGHRLLLTGDLETAGERRLLSRTPPGALGVDVLKLGHHGSGGSTATEFLRAVAPRLAVVSAGRGNPYGHPSWRVLARLEEAAVPLLRTDRDGLIRLALPPDGPLRISLPASPR